ncbi:MAG: outer membrane lipoprotein-sorting protein [Terracidiphilus sp.]
MKRSLVLAASLALLLIASRALFAADDLQSVLRQLDAAAEKFHSTSADVQFDSVETEPIPITDVQKGTVYYERKGGSFRMAAHINEFNGQPVTKVYTFAGGVFRLFEGGNVDQVTTFSKASKFESYLMLGFGASGTQLADKWNITYDGQETVDGVKTDKLELVAKDPTVRKNLPKVTIWIDPSRGVNIKQVFDEGDGQSKTAHYFNIKVNQSLPGDAFKFKTDGKTQYINR